MIYTEEESRWLSGTEQLAPLDDRCAKGQAINCPHENGVSFCCRYGFEDVSVIRRKSPEGWCWLIPTYSDGTEGIGFRCTDADAAWQIDKLRLR